MERRYYFSREDRPLKLLWILRILLYVQTLLGLVRYFGPSVGLLLNPRLWETHISLGVIIALLAIYALRPLPEVPTAPIRTVARFLPLAPLALGLGFLAGLPTGPLVIVHMLLGLAAVGSVEMAAARQRRALSAASQK
ncbi:MAG TPA: hypothetical protein VKY56_11235 [Chloroflexota bacterium]|jgi:cytochrome b561|nr:hypothetical protein [Chloroflexota bacterium]